MFAQLFTFKKQQELHLGISYLIGLGFLVLEIAELLLGVPNAPPPHRPLALLLLATAS
jgi:hypothetical protein